MSRHGGVARNAVLREHPRHDREYTSREAAEDHGGRAVSRPREARNDEPRGEREGPDRRKDDRGSGGERPLETGGHDDRDDERDHGPWDHDGCGHKGWTIDTTHASLERRLHALIGLSDIYHHRRSAVC